MGGGGIAIVAIFLLSQLAGFDLAGILGGGGTGGTDGPGQEDSALSECQTGADANESVDCRMAGALLWLDDYWIKAAPTVGIDFREPDFILFDGATTTVCGNATSAVGPFYCPPDETIYIDTTFYDALRDRFGASGGPLAELYVVAHEYGHHLQQTAGRFEGTDRSDTGPGSDTIRLEVQAE